MRILADVHISPSTVLRLNDLGHDAVRADTILPGSAADRAIVGLAVAEDRVILTQDLDFSEIIALSGDVRPSLITLRLSDPTVENVNLVLESVLPDLEPAVVAGIAATVEDNRTRIRQLPIS